MNNKGFTIIELSIVIVIIGMLMIPAFQMFDTYLYNKRVSETREHLKKIQAEISIFQVKNGYYPCPSDRSLAPNHPDYGKEDCSLQVPAATGCAAGDGLCHYAGTRNTDELPGNETILYGGVPFKTLSDLGEETPMIETDFRRISSDEILDGWGNQLTYAVTESQTNHPTDADWKYSDLAGTILLQDEFGNPVSDFVMNAGVPSGKLHYVVISHGKDGLGAFDKYGYQDKPCATGIFGAPGGPPATGPIIPGTPAKRDVANCDPNGVFLLGLNYSESTDVTHFDDTLVFGQAATSGLWAVARDEDGNAVENTIVNLNAGNVGIGTNAPLTTFDVDGSIRAETNIRTPRICDRDGTNCFDMSILANPEPDIPDEADEGNGAVSGIRCADGRAMVGISEADEQCSAVAMPTTWVAQTCGITSSGRKTWLRGIRTDGTIECTN